MTNIEFAEYLSKTYKIEGLKKLCYKHSIDIPPNANAKSIVKLISQNISYSKYKGSNIVLRRILSGLGLAISIIALLYANYRFNNPKQIIPELFAVSFEAEISNFSHVTLNHLTRKCHCSQNNVKAYCSLDREESINLIKEIIPNLLVRTEFHNENENVLSVQSTSNLENRLPFRDLWSLSYNPCKKKLLLSSEIECYAQRSHSIQHLEESINLDIKLMIRKNLNLITSMDVKWYTLRTPDGLLLEIKGVKNFKESKRSFYYEYELQSGGINWR